MGRVYPTVSLYRCNSGPVCRCVAFPHITMRTLPTRRVMFVMQPALVAAVAAVPTVEIAPGVHMPMISLGPRQARSPHAQPLPTPRLTAQCARSPAPGMPLRYLAVQLVARRECGEPRAQAWLHAHRHRQRLQEPRRRRPRTGASHHRSRSASRNATLLALALALNRLRTRPPTRP